MRVVQFQNRNRIPRKHLWLINRQGGDYFHASLVSRWHGFPAARSDKLPTHQCIRCLPVNHEPEKRAGPIRRRSVKRRNRRIQSQTILFYPSGNETSHGSLLCRGCQSGTVLWTWTAFVRWSPSNGSQSFRLPKDFDPEAMGTRRSVHPARMRREDQK
ncbi:hypothetical protein P170DRAFT_27316 [Aspergillus steynii IBT 23096]|uniref:Uncharacterized protein n=1 Tax=Aspergillus steynii IBT 23096 TaxID=1392250 RepID=A0A2I2GPZ0_9EURO|nr:uncharacterized protein P170DRAFT_27316 [Aspergillus steynii IBT 23096]PLB54943.1 hypothetical protein P170DRAFT_27316 [Aspergillus steynii IBT 23096]